MRSILPEGAAEWNEPGGGFFYWLRLPGLDAHEVFLRSVDEKVAFVPGTAFFPDAGEQVGEARFGNDFARLCFTFANAAQIQEGCRRLAKALTGCRP